MSTSPSRNRRTSLEWALYPEYRPPNNRRLFGRGCLRGLDGARLHWVPPYTLSAVERKGKYANDFCLKMAKAKARIWPGMSYIFHIHSTVHPGGISGANLKSIPHRCYLREVAFVWKVTEETSYSPLGCLKGGYTNLRTTDGLSGADVLVGLTERGCTGSKPPQP